MKVKTNNSNPEYQTPEELEERLRKLESSNQGLAWGLALGVFGAIIIACVFFFWPYEENKPVPNETVQKIHIPENWQAQIDAINAKVASAQKNIDAVAVSGAAITQEIIGKDAGTMEERLAALELQVNALGGSKALSDMIARINRWQSQHGGQEYMNDIINHLLQATNAAKSSGQEGINGALEEARKSSDAVGDAMEGIPQTELKAAAILLAMTQVRSALNRNDVPFDDDLALIKNLVDPENVELVSAIDTLAPNAKSGVLTVDGLSDELKTLAGDAAFDALSGQDVDLQSRAATRFNELIKVEKNGQPINETPEQKAIDDAQLSLESGNISGAIDIISSLEGTDAFAPWIAKAKATLETNNATDSLKSLLVDEITGGELIYDEELGINVYHRNIIN